MNSATCPLPYAPAVPGMAGFFRMLRQGPGRSPGPYRLAEESTDREDLAPRVLLPSTPRPPDRLDCPAASRDQLPRLRPPSTMMRWPVMNPAPSEARKLTAW